MCDMNILWAVLKKFNAKMENNIKIWNNKNSYLWIKLEKILQAILLNSLII